MLIQGLRKCDANLLSTIKDILAQARAKVCPEAELSVLVAVSGGEDSHVLLHALSRLSKECRLRLIVAHFDHALRPDSDKDLLFVHNLARRYSCLFSSERAKEGYGRENIEAWARRTRYAFLEKARASEACHVIATAHHLNDQAETVIHRILSGRYLTDANAIAELDFERHLIRPLLRVTKAEIEDYSVQHGLDFVFDSTNEDLSRTRNRIRNSLIPALEADYNPRLVHSLGQLAERFGNDESYLMQRAQRVLRSLGQEPKVEDLMGLPIALLWRVLLTLALEQVGPDAGKLGYKAYFSVAEVLRSKPSGRKSFDLGFGITCQFSRGSTLLFTRAWDNKSGVDGFVKSVTLGVPGVVERRYGDGSCANISAKILSLKEEGQEQLGKIIEWTKAVVGEGNAERAAVEYFDYETLPDITLSVRERAHGDSMQVFRRGGRKLKKLFLEHKVNPRVRDNVPIVQSGEDIIWVPGVARADLAPLTPGSRRVLELRYQRYC